MSRTLIFVLLLAACSQDEAKPSLATGTFAGEGRDRLCIAGEPGAYRAGLIAYGQDNVNCMAAGRLQRAGAGWALIPTGEGDCRIPLSIDGNAIRIGQPQAACSYYCGPGVSMAARTYDRTDTAANATDLAGDPLC
jgi:hypothetical protein